MYRYTYCSVNSRLLNATPAFRNQSTLIIIMIDRFEHYNKLDFGNHSTKTPFIFLSKKSIP